MRGRVPRHATARILPSTATAPPTIPREPGESSGWGQTHIRQPITPRPPIGTKGDPLIRHRREDPVTQLLRQGPKRRAILLLPPDTKVHGPRLLDTKHPGMHRPVRVTPRRDKATRRRVRAMQPPLCRGRNSQGQATPLLAIRPRPPHSVVLPRPVASPARVVAVVVVARQALQDPVDGKSAYSTFYTFLIRKPQSIQTPSVIFLS